MIVHRYVAPAVAAIVFFVIGAIWYSALQGPWLEGIAKTLEQLTGEQGGSPRPYLVGFAAILVMCYTLGWLIRRLDCSGVVAGMKVGATLALGLIGAMLALNYAFESRLWSLWLINAGYALIGLSISGGILAGWKRLR